MLEPGSSRGTRTGATGIAFSHGSAALIARMARSYNPPTTVWSSAALRLCLVTGRARRALLSVMARLALLACALLPSSNA
jgi:hypothetical protein